TVPNLERYLVSNARKLDRVRSPESAQYVVVPAGSFEEIEAVHSLQAEIWGSELIATPSTLLHVISQAGGSVLLAKVGDRPIGFAYGFVGRSPDGVTYLRSHAAGVLAEFRNSGVGRALKLAQRQAGLAVGLNRIVWTFDPSQVGNAHFNLRRLGATARGFRHDYYGQRDDALSHGLPTDRLIVEWFLGDSEQVELARLRRRSNLVSVRVPEGLPAEAGRDHAKARRLQSTLRKDLESALAQGLEVIDFDAETRSYRLATLPSSFPAPVEGGSSSGG
ncbi:MAG: GNAT family N-acetyltransferase, partial [Candidatus Dormiibacterota bacterium]